MGPGNHFRVQSAARPASLPQPGGQNAPAHWHDHAIPPTTAKILRIRVNSPGANRLVICKDTADCREGWFGPARFEQLRATPPRKCPSGHPSARVGSATLGCVDEVIRCKGAPLLSTERVRAGQIVSDMQANGRRPGRPRVLIRCGWPAGRAFPDQGQGPARFRPDGVGRRGEQSCERRSCLWPSWGH
jgi:hypothetical protein